MTLTKIKIRNFLLLENEKVVEISRNFLLLEGEKVVDIRITVCNTQIQK